MVDYETILTTRIRPHAGPNRFQSSRQNLQGFLRHTLGARNQGLSKRERRSASIKSVL